MTKKKTSPAERFTCAHCNESMDESEQCWTCPEYCQGCVFSIIEENETRLLRERNGDEIHLVWSVEDVLSAEVRPDLTIEQAREVLDVVRRHHDCTIGVSWETLRIEAEYLYPKK